MKTYNIKVTWNQPYSKKSALLKRRRGQRPAVPAIDERLREKEFGIVYRLTRLSIEQR